MEGSIEDLFDRTGIKDFRFHDLRYIFCIMLHDESGDLYQPTKILDHSNIKKKERYAKLARQHIARTSNTAWEIWKLFEPATCSREKSLQAFLTSLSC
jgi:site-specific recombinase XerD